MTNSKVGTEYQKIGYDISYALSTGGSEEAAYNLASDPVDQVVGGKGKMYRWSGLWMVGVANAVYQFPSAMWYWGLRRLDAASGGAFVSNGTQPRSAIGYSRAAADQKWLYFQPMGLLPNGEMLTTGATGDDPWWYFRFDVRLNGGQGINITDERMIALVVGFLSVADEASCAQLAHRIHARGIFS